MENSHTNLVNELVNIKNTNLYNVNSVALGFKYKNNTFTDEKCIRFGVTAKLPLSVVPLNQQIPSTITVNGIEYNTDVYECSKQAYISKITSQQLLSGNSAYTTLTNTNTATIAGTFDNCWEWLLTTIPAGQTVTPTVQFCGLRETTQPLIDGSLVCMDNNYTPTNGVYSGISYFWTKQTYGFTSCNQCYNCYNVGPAVIPWDAPLPVQTNRNATRPLRGGTSMCSPPPTNYVNTATLGGMVIDNLDGKLVGLTNNHVCGDPGQDYPSNCTFIASDPYGATFAAYSDICMYQQSSWDSGIAKNSPDYIGSTKRAYPLTSTGVNYVDCGVVNINQNSYIDTNSWQLANMSYANPHITSPLPFATTDEINSLTPSTVVFKTARTTGPVGGGTGEDGCCQIFISDISTTVSVGGYIDYKLYPTAPALQFADVLSIVSPYPCNATVGIGGDSGSLVIAYISGTWKIIGLFFAYDTVNNIGFACRIDRVVSNLNISAYLGTAVTATPSVCSFVNFPASTYENVVSFTQAGKTYWQVGKLNY